jgi:hypothetical protein
VYLRKWVPSPPPQQIIYTRNKITYEVGWRVKTLQVAAACIPGVRNELSSPQCAVCNSLMRSTIPAQPY